MEDGAFAEPHVVEDRAEGDSVALSDACEADERVCVDLYQKFLRCTILVEGYTENRTKPDV